MLIPRPDAGDGQSTRVHPRTLVRERVFVHTDPMALTRGQLTLDDLGTPLADVTFCVIDLETTGGSADSCGITEVGAVKLRGGECLGTFQTLVNPGCAIPPEITVLTGITHAMVDARAPHRAGPARRCSSSWATR